MRSRRHGFGGATCWAVLSTSTNSLLEGPDRWFKCPSPFDEVLRTEGVRIVKTPIRSPRANAHAQRWIRTARAECLEWILVLGRRHLERVLRTYAAHYNRGPTEA